MNTQPLLGLAGEQALAVVAAQQEGEPVEVGAQLNEVIGTAAHETAQRHAKPIGVSGKPVMQELEQFGQFDSIAGIQVHSGYGGCRPWLAGRIEIRSLPHRRHMHVARTAAARVTERLRSPGHLLLVSNDRGVTRAPSDLRVQRAHTVAHRVRWSPPLEAQRFVIHDKQRRGLELNPVDSKQFPTRRLHEVELGNRSEGQVDPVDAGLLAQFPHRGLTWALSWLSRSPRQLPLLAPAIEHHQDDVHMNDNDQRRGHGCLLGQARQLLFRDETNGDQGVADTITDRKRSHEAHPTATPAEAPGTSIEHAAEQPPRSSAQPACSHMDRYRIFAITCPFHGNAGWRWVRDNDPEGWAEAVEFDRAIRHGYPHATKQGQQLRGQYLLHRSCVPLDQVDLDAPAKSRTKKHLRLITADSAHSVEEDGDPDGCSPWSCRSGEPIAGTGRGHGERAA